MSRRGTAGYGVQHLPHLVAFQHLSQAGQVVLVWMGEHQEVNAPLPEGEPAPQALVRALGLGPPSTGVMRL